MVCLQAKGGHQKHERRERERHEQREIAEEHALEEEVQRRLVDGDLREKVAARVAEALAMEEVQARVSTRCDAERAKRLTAALDAIEAERVERIRAAQQREEDRLSEARELQDILRENERKVNAEKRQRMEGQLEGLNKLSLDTANEVDGKMHN